MKNPHTTVAGIVGGISFLIAFLSAFADKLIDVAAVLPADWLPPIKIGSAIIAAVSFAWHGVAAKDAGTKDAGDGTGTMPGASVIVALLLPALALSGCVTDAVTGKKRLATGAEIAADVAAFQANPKVKAAEGAAAAAVASFIFDSAQQEFNGRAFDSSFAFAAGFNAISAAVRTLPNNEAATLIVQTAKQYSADPTTGNVARKLAAAYLAANPQTPAEKSATVVALGTGSQSGAQAAAEVLP